MKLPQVGAHRALPDGASWSGRRGPRGRWPLARLTGALGWPPLVPIVVDVALVVGGATLVVIFRAFGIAAGGVLLLLRCVTTLGGGSVVIRAPMSAGGTGVIASRPRRSTGLQRRCEAKGASLDPREQRPAAGNLLGGLVSMRPLGRHAGAPPDPSVAGLARRIAWLSPWGGRQRHACDERAAFVAHNARAVNPVLGAPLPPPARMGGARTGGDRQLGGRGRAGFAVTLLDRHATQRSDSAPWVELHGCCGLSIGCWGRGRCRRSRGDARCRQRHTRTPSPCGRLKARASASVVGSVFGRSDNMQLGRRKRLGGPHIARR